MALGVKGFQKGDPNINRNGAPKKQFRRDDFTDEIFDERKTNGDIRKVIDIWFDYALIDRERWAIERIIDIFLTKAKNRDEITSDGYAKTVLTLSQIPEEKLVQVRDILLD